MLITRMALAIWLTTVTSHAQANVPKLTVCLRFSGFDRLVIGPLAQGLAARMFAQAGVSVAWKAAAPGGSRRPIVVHLVGNVAPDFMPGALAYTELNRGGGITVFLDRVENLENPAIVLAHVLVHEITHAVQGVNRHSETGVMKAHWTGHEYSLMRRHPLGFAPEDVELIQQALSDPPGRADPGPVPPGAERNGERADTRPFTRY